MRIELEQYSPPLGDGEALLKFSGTMPMQLHEHERRKGCTKEAPLQGSLT